jgi:hypothetical protein
MTVQDYPHQELEREHFLDPARFLFWPMRVGKTKSAIDCAYELHGEGLIQGVIVVAPVGVHAQWPDELAKLVPHWFERRDAWAWGEPMKGKVQPTPAFNSCEMGRLGWFCVGKEHLIMDSVWKLLVWFARRFKCLLVIDESHHFRTPSAKRTRRAIALAANCPYRRLLTGSRDDNSPMNNWSQYEILERGALGCRTFSGFRERFAILEQTRGHGGRLFPKIVGFKNRDELHARMAPFTHEVREEAVAGLALPRFHRRAFELGARERKIYDQLREETRVRLESGEIIDAVSEAAMLVRLQQVASGFAKDEHGQDHIIGESRTEALVELTEEIRYPDRQIVVWARFQRDVRAVTQALRRLHGDGVAEINGDVPKHTRKLVMDRFNAGTVRAIVADPGCAGEGFDLAAARSMIWYSHTWDAAARRQACARATKIGLDSSDVIDLVGRGTVDEAILGCIDAKRETSNATRDIFAAVFGRWRDPLLD